MSFQQMVEEELSAAHGRSHPCYAEWLEAIHGGIDHQAALIERTCSLAGTSLRGARVLDLGCGLGSGCIALSRFGPRQILGMDLRLHGLGLLAARVRLEEQGTQATLVCGAGETLPFRSDSVDSCVCDQVLEHVSDARRLLHEIHRVLVPGGCAYIGTPNRFFPREGHSGLYFASWLPRKACERYVRWRGVWKPDAVWDVETRSYFAVVRLLRRQGFDIVGDLPDFISIWQKRWSRKRHRAWRLYTSLTKIVRIPMGLLAPWISVAVKKRAHR